MIVKLLLVLIIIIGFWARIYKLDSPIADWHSWRQSDTASVTKNFVQEGFNPFFPKALDMSTVSDVNFPNIERTRFVEFPIYNIATYPFVKIFGINDRYSRLVSVLFSLGSIVFIYLITRKYLGKVSALLASLIFAILPYNIFYSRSTLPEPTFVFFALGMVHFVDELIWKNKFLWLAFLFTVIAFLIKPWAIFFCLPLLYSYYKKNGTIFKKELFIFSFLAISPFILWRLWIFQRPEAIPASIWLMDGDSIRFKPAFFRWIIAERIGKEILGVTGTILFFIGVLFKPKDGNYFLHIWVLSLFLYFSIFATGNVRHDYYQVIFVPIAGIFLARGFVILISEHLNLIARVWRIPLGLLFIILTIYFTHSEVKELYKINNPVIIEAGKFADQNLPKDAIVLAPYNGDSAFLYQVNRPGFPIASLPIAQLVTNYGVNYYVSVNHDNQTNWVLRHFKIIEDNPKFVIVDLTKIEKPFDGKDPEPN